MSTRAAILRRAFTALAVADYVFDISPEEQAFAFDELDAMMAEWEAVGLILGYVPGGDNPAGSDETGTEAWADSAIATNLALRLGPSFGKMPMPGVQLTAKRGLNLVTVKALSVPSSERPSLTIAGAGGVA